MNDFVEEIQDELVEKMPEYYEVVPEFNREGRLCNYHTGAGKPIKVMANEWDRFNKLAGRQHKVVDGIIVFDGNLKICMPS